MSVFDHRLDRIQNMLDNLRLDMIEAEERVLPPYVPLVKPGSVVCYGSRDPEYRLIIQTKLLPPMYGAIDLESNLLLAERSDIISLMSDGHYDFMYASLEEYYAAL